MAGTFEISRLLEAARLVEIAAMGLDTRRTKCDCCGRYVDADEEEARVAQHLEGTAEKLRNQARRLQAALNQKRGDTPPGDNR